ncbi:outer membrane beta-barrel protein [Aequorivita echinoideorum]|uniref:Outer membrane beta-barrel protein n=1 Tax=Aequorivita echinoideorum TaxID=1549647 RepID=A0ABS5S6F0_9FLAO|nr:outer membrane beta-barrel protein [Aequorivita echinoideorum]
MSSETIVFDEFKGFSVDYNKTNYRLGIDFEYFLKENFSLNSAIRYSNKDFTGTYYCEVCDFTVPPSPQEIKLSFIEMPLTAKYYFLPNKVRLFGKLGLTNLFLLNKDVLVNSYVVGFRIGGGVEYNLTQEVALLFNMDYNNSISKLYKESDYNLKSIAFGIGVMKRM